MNTSILLEFIALVIVGEYGRSDAHGKVVNMHMYQYMSANPFQEHHLSTCSQLKFWYKTIHNRLKVRLALAAES